MSLIEEIYGNIPLEEKAQSQQVEEEDKEQNFDYI